MPLTLYGIRNCDTMKKAQQWLDAAQIPYAFHDYKVAGAPPERLAAWIEARGWETLLNRAGTSFRKLPETDRADLDANRAMALMLANPSMIRRPVLEGSWQGAPILLIGFKPADYEPMLPRS